MSDPPIGRFLVDLDGPRVERLPGFEALGMRGSASGRLRPGRRAASLWRCRERRRADRSGPAPLAVVRRSAIAAVYLGIGEGARDAVARWALDRRPGDGSTAVADLPERPAPPRPDGRGAASRPHRPPRGAPAAGTSDRTPTDITLAKLVATDAAVDATDEALRIAGGPGFLAGRAGTRLPRRPGRLINPPLEDVALTGFAARLLDELRDGWMIEPRRRSPTATMRRRSRPSRTRPG